MMTIFRSDRQLRARRKAGRWGWVVVAACGCTAAPSPPPAPQVLAEPVPSQLLFGLRVSGAEQLYGLVQAASTQALPRALAVLLSHSLGLPPTISGRFRTDRPIVGALGVDANQRLLWSVGLPVVSGRELVAELSLGVQAPFQAHVNGRLTELRGAVFGPLGPINLAVAGNLLIVGGTQRAVAEFGPYLATHVDSEELAPPLTEPGIALRSFSTGTQLQGLMAMVGDGFAQPQGVGIGATVSRLLDFEQWGGQPIGDLVSELYHTASAYIGHVDSSQATLTLDGANVDLSWKAIAPSLPPLRSQGPTACRDLASLPQGVGAWVLGVNAEPDPSQRTADWDLVDSTWPQPLVGFFGSLSGSAQTESLGFGQKSPSESDPATRAPWLVAWYEHGSGATLLGAFRGLQQERFAQLLGLGPVTLAASADDGVYRKSAVRDGKPLEVAWAVRADGVVAAVGAPLGATWSSWVRQPEPTARPRFLSAATCQSLIAAAGYWNVAEVFLYAIPGGMQGSGRLDLRELQRLAGHR